ncbi:ATP-binding domain-containing protein [Nitrosomonas sp.]|uniref:ATP-binding domain-containing protein n=1 Tax=Nitrosomonas sp. TaxID=42353 RepID=UPI0025FC4C4D|nr:ATP-binding domain-containing protein [Nitrosomonas sp.]
MANLIPDSVPNDAPDSEKRIFNYLKSDPGTEGWTVFHSLGLSQRGVKKPYGEIDFVIVVPMQGVICLEIKGGGVSCKNGQWLTTDRNQITHKLKKSPFIQAREGMLALRDAVNENVDRNINQCFFCTAVVFPDVESPPVTPEFERDEVIDVSELGKQISAIIESKIKSQRKRLGWIKNPSLTEPSDIKALTKYLRPDFELKALRTARIRRDKEDLVTLTREQVQFLEGCIDNPRCLVKGAAGTGKTLMAIEALKMKSQEGLKTGFFCYNKVLGGWLQREISSLELKDIYVGGIYENLVELIRNSSFYSEYNSERQKTADGKPEIVFRKLIPHYAMEAIMETGEELDYLILDEGQDLIRPEILDVFDIWLRGGLQKGNWIILGDFHNQAIYSEGLKGSALIVTLENYTSHYSNFKLSLNCRNTKNIAEATALFSGFENIPYRINQIEGEPVNRSFWNRKDDLEAKLLDQIRKLLGEGIMPSEISILSPRKFSDSSASKISEFAINDISNSSDVIPKDNEIIFSTIHSFKGLESPIVIITDIESISGNYNSSLLYIAMSRASAYLSMLMNENVREELKAVMSKAIEGYD